MVRIMVVGVGEPIDATIGCFSTTSKAACLSRLGQLWFWHWQQPLQLTLLIKLSLGKGIQGQSTIFKCDTQPIFDTDDKANRDTDEELVQGDVGPLLMLHHTFHSLPAPEDN